MKLVPYPYRAKRLEKVVRHWFSTGERWWEIADGDLVAWTRDWRAIRVTGAFATPKGWLLIEEGSDADARAAAAHERWMAAAERACDEATSRRTVFPAEDRVCYVGEGGVTVITAGGRKLVTCFRPVPSAVRRHQDPDAFDRLALDRAWRRSGLHRRQAVRNQSRRASLLADTQEKR